ncbi:FtsH protease activity modulator HflK [Iodobacter fluviatilis]|uniref:Protein HflK n=1 Tax=Iodobacter fluviatilis TaxID=537 RepID=A0A377Q7H8_9NEIS|nr:FtsH protease activity modulator HflK [Iodobacter fluviatilis]TCU89503.1 protease FtsH subunit HflK [Iodobacter fluviatilis]STQ90873.1 Modulator of FtsH protease HflK [Iodobacter fluviatilis]
MSQNDPQWGGRRNGPPDLDEIIRNITGKISRLLGGDGAPPAGGNSRGGTGAAVVVAVAVAVLWAASGFYVVDERENAVIMRFGRYVETVEKPGLHWHLPWPVESREIVNMTEIRSLEVGSSGGEGRAGDESMMLTGDQNILEVRLEVQYNLKSAHDFVFFNRTTDRDAKDLVKQIAQTAIREVVGKNKVDYVLNEGRGKIGEDTKEIVQNLLDRYGVGVAVSRVNISDVQPPDQVQAAFSDAVKARQDKARLINEGTAYANDVIPKAGGMAARLSEESEGYRSRVVSQAEGDASRFKQVAAEYAKAPQVTRDRMYFDTMQQVFQNTTKLLIDQKSNGNLLYLPLDKLMQMTSPAAAPAPAAEAAKAAEPAAEAAVNRNVRATLRDGR